MNVDKGDCIKFNKVREWYLPHHPVVHPHKPGKIRRVLNGAAKFQGQSLNNLLLTRPDLLQNLIQILIRYRQHPHAASGDIEGMFLQVGVIPDNKPSLRYLWREDPASEVAVFQKFVTSSDLRTPTCANYALRRTATDNASQFPETAQSVIKIFYMDDYLESSPTAEEAKDLVNLLSLGGFKLTKFVSSVPSITPQLEADSTSPTEGKELPSTGKLSHVD